MPHPGPPADLRRRKDELRAGLRGARLAMSDEGRAQAASSLADAVLALPELAGVDTVAAYVSYGTEPATAPILDALRSTGRRVLLPVLLPDRDLDWAAYVGGDGLVATALAGRGRLLEPAGPRLGAEAIASAGLVLVPALAVGRAGTRLGQGGGSYDRALARVPADVPVAALLYDGELLEAEPPSEPHDRPVTLAVLPAGVVRLLG